MYVSRPSQICLKWSRAFRKLPLALSTLAVLTAPSVFGGTLYWTSSGNLTAYGGDGTWETSGATNWNTSPTIGAGSPTAWTGAAGDSAAFLPGTSGTITVNGTVTVNASGTSAINLGSNAGSFTNSAANYTFNGGVLDLRPGSFGFPINVNAGTGIFNSQVNLFGDITTGGTLRILAGANATATVNNIVDISNTTTGIRLLRLEGGNNATITLGNITKTAAGTGTTIGIKLQFSLATNSSSATYILNGSNAGLSTSTVDFLRGTVVLNNSTALRGGITVKNATTGTTGTTPDTAQLLIGTGGVNYAQNVTFEDVAAGDTADIRTLGGSNTSGTATFSGGITVGAQATSGTGSTLQLTAASGGVVILSGLINDAANTSNLTKVGAGDVKLNRAAGNTYDGLTTISNGELYVNNTSGSGTGTGSVSVAASGTLAGTGFILTGLDNSLTVNGKLAVGDGASVADMNITTSGLGALNIGATGRVSLELFTNTLAGADKLITSGGVNLAGGSALELLNTGGLGFAEGNAFDLFDWGTAPVGTFTTVDLPTLGSGLTWDTSALYSTGIVSVVPEPSGALLLTLGGITLLAVRRRKP